MFRFTFVPIRAVVAATILCGGLTTVASASAATITALGRTPAYATATYGIKDVGAPPSTYSSFTQPLGFNKTGQIVGQAVPSTAPGNSFYHCIAWTGKAWVDLFGTTSLTCYDGTGISDANSSGVFAAVGATYVPTGEQMVAYYSTVSPTSAKTVTFPANSVSILYAMNASGLAAGYTYYAPYGGFSTNDATVTTTGSTLALLQPSCTTAKTGCVSQPFYYASFSAESRTMNAGGTILAYALNATNGQYIEYEGGSKPSYVQFSLPYDGNNGPFGARGMDDKGNVVYEEFNSSAEIYYPRLYSPSSKKARNLGGLSGSTCNQYVPLYVNGPGRVFGETEGCSISKDYVYWTWDATNGMVAVGFSRNDYSTVYLYLMNDAGQIVGDFYEKSGKHHWAYLTPPAKL